MFYKFRDVEAPMVTLEVEGKSQELNDDFREAQKNTIGFRFEDEETAFEFAFSREDAKNLREVLRLLEQEYVESDKEKENAYK